MEKKSYEECFSELEKLVSEIENPDKPLSEVSGDVKKALELIKACRKELKLTREEIESLTDEK